MTVSLAALPLFGSALSLFRGRADAAHSGPTGGVDIEAGAREWVSGGAVGLGGIPSTDRISPKLIDPSRDGLQVCRVYAGSDSTEVIHFEFGRDRPHEPVIGPTMGEPVPVPVAELPVTIWSKWAIPQPAARWCYVVLQREAGERTICPQRPAPEGVAVAPPACVVDRTPTERLMRPRAAFDRASTIRLSHPASATGSMVRRPRVNARGRRHSTAVSVWE